MEKINIFNAVGELKYKVSTNFKKFLKDHNMPVNAFVLSRVSSGKPIYQDLSKKGETRLTNNGHINFKGWYAIKEDIKEEC